MAKGAANKNPPERTTKRNRDHSGAVCLQDTLAWIVCECVGVVAAARERGV